MKHRSHESKNESFESLIDAEVDSALAKFRSGRFEANVRESIREMAGRKSVDSLPHGLPRPARIAVAAGLLAGVVTIMILFQRTPRPDMAQAIENALQRTPGILALERHPSERLLAQEEIPSFLNNEIQSALRLGRRKPAPARQSVEGAAIPGKIQNLRPLTLEETYKILVIDKSVERVLALIS